MRSELKVSSPSLKVTFTIGFFVTIVVIFLAMIYRFEVSLILLSVAGVGFVFVAGRVMALIHNKQLGRLDVEKKRQELRLSTYQADRAELQAFVVSFPRNHRVVTMSNSPIQIVDAIAEPSIPMLPETIIHETMPNLLDVIKNESCVAVWGGRSSGKTTIALHWLSTRQGKNVVCDPKPVGHNLWPSAIVTNRIDSIENTVNNVYAELLRRQDNGLLSEPTITLFIDELFTLTKVHSLDIMTHTFGIITMGREYQINAGFTTSSKGVKSLGIEGMSGLAEALTFVHASIVGGVHKVTVDLGEGEVQALSPGPYTPPTIPPIWPDIEPIVHLTEAERMEQAILRGDSNNQICRDILGGKNGDRIARLNVIRQGLEWG